jgi:hypothetical protein
MGFEGLPQRRLLLLLLLVARCRNMPAIKGKRPACWPPIDRSIDPEGQNQARSHGALLPWMESMYVCRM